MSEGGASKEEIEAFSAHQKEFQGIRNGVASVTLAWAAAENSLVQLLTAILGRTNMRVPSAMYFSLTGIETRIRLVDRGLRELLCTVEGSLVEQGVIARIEAVWTTIENCLQRLRKTRNKVAHGEITSFAVGSGDVPIPKLTSPALDISIMRSWRETGQLPGLSANDLKVSQLAVYAVSNKIADFSRMIASFHNGDGQALLETLAALEGKPPKPGGSADLV